MQLLTDGAVGDARDAVGSGGYCGRGGVPADLQVAAVSHDAKGGGRIRLGARRGTLSLAY
jgi:hypothetical protein